MKNILFLIAFHTLFSNCFATLEVRKSNDVLNIPIGAKVLSSGGILLGANPNLERVLFHPALAIEIKSSVAVNHINYFADTDLNTLSGLFNLKDSQSAFFLSISRFGADKIPLTFEDSSGRPVDKNGRAIEGNPETFSVQDIWISSGYGLQILRLNFGISFNFLYRDLGDQWVLGMRSDVSVAKHFKNKFRIDGLLKSWSTSALLSEGGNIEYEPTDLYLGTGYPLDVPYFYGNVNFSWQSPPLIHKGNRSREDVSGSRIFDSPGMWLGDSKFGVEYASKWDVGLSIGWSIIREWKYPAWGFNFDIKQFEASYGWEAHPELGSIHSFGLNYHFGNEPGIIRNSQIPLKTNLSNVETFNESLNRNTSDFLLLKNYQVNTNSELEEVLFEEVLAEESIQSKGNQKLNANDTLNEFVTGSLDLINTTKHLDSLDKINSIKFDTLNGKEEDIIADSLVKEILLETHSDSMTIEKVDTIELLIEEKDSVLILNESRESQLINITEESLLLDEEILHP